MRARRKFYAVRSGRHPGIYSSWEACEAQVKGYPGAQFKAFPTREEAETYLQQTPLNQSLTPPFPQPRSGKRQGSEPRLHIWVDGACLPQSDGTLKVGWAFVALEDGRELCRMSGNDVPIEALEHRNVAGEIMAVLKAVAWSRKHRRRAITIHYDYQGLASWISGEWQAKTPFTQAYAKTVRDSGLKIHWVKVKSHSGEPFNDLADQLAREAAQ